MFRGLFEGPGIWIVLAVVLLLFGATRLPALARSIGQSTKIFREEIKTDKTADPATPAATDAAPMTVPEPVAPAVATAEPNAPKKSAKQSPAAPGKSGKTAKS
ncbi:MAG: twin-arginine translocase TatA/TatE family subunit [Pseudolysinimonas sp.]